MKHSIKVKANIILDNSGKIVYLPIIVTEDGVLRSYLQYLITHRFRSRSWQNKSIFSVRLLIDYTNVNVNAFENPKILFREFSECLFTGTVGNNNNDPSGLFWKPRQINDACSIVTHITSYTDWLSETNSDPAFALNPYRAATNFEERLNWAAHKIKKENTLLSHLWKKEHIRTRMGLARTIGKRPKPYINEVFSTVKAFPKGRIDDLIFTGFVRPGKESATDVSEKLNLRDVLITILMHYGGLRISEAIQLYTEDIAHVDISDIRGVVKVHDPVRGRSPVNDKQVRKDFLLSNYSLLPRCEYPQSSRQFAGWKNPMLTNAKAGFFTVEFFPLNSRDLFFDLWSLYLKHQRISPDKKHAHPYAFTSRDGRPYTIKSYSAARKRAVERIGLQYSKSAFTTAHSDRHSYGQRLSESGLSPLIIKTAMHHRSHASQETYTQPSEAELRKELLKADRFLEALTPTSGRYFDEKNKE